MSDGNETQAQLPNEYSLHSYQMFITFARCRNYRHTAATPQRIMFTCLKYMRSNPCNVLRTWTHAQLPTECYHTCVTSSFQTRSMSSGSTHRRNSTPTTHCTFINIACQMFECLGGQDTCPTRLLNSLHKLTDRANRLVVNREYSIVTDADPIIQIEWLVAQCH